MKIDTSHFTDAQYMTAQQKWRVLGDWVRFFQSGMELKRFTKRLYQHLTLHCEFIAHFNRHGFFETYFADPEALQRFLDQFDRSKGCVSTEYGMTYWIRDGNEVSAAYYDLVSVHGDETAERHLPPRSPRAPRKAATACWKRKRCASVVPRTGIPSWETATAPLSCYPSPPLASLAFLAVNAVAGRERLHDLNDALVDAIADMLPALREEARRRAVEAAQQQVGLAEQKLARLVAGRSKGR